MKENRITASDVIAALKLRFASPQFAFLEQVADGTGARSHRWADAVAMSVWPSRGYDIHGIEVKVSRYDFLNEIKNPAKAEAVQKYCNRWWMAVGDKKIVQAGELPPTWGLLALNGKRMQCIVEAPPLTPEPIGMPFVASVLRNMAVADESKVDLAKRRGYDEGYKTAQEGDYYRRKYDDLKKSLEEFEEKSGIKIDSYSGAKLGTAVNLLTQAQWKIDALHGATKAAQDIHSLLDEITKVLPEVLA